MNEILSETGEQAWQSMLLGLESSRGFSILFVFSSILPLVDLFRSRLEDIYRTRPSRLECLAPLFHDKVAERLLEEILGKTVDPGKAASPLWLELHAGKGLAWDHARVELLKQLEEKRETLRKSLPRPLILSLPADFRHQAFFLAPQLWEMRKAGIHLSGKELGNPDAGSSAMQSQEMWDRARNSRLREKKSLFSGWQEADLAMAQGKHLEALRISEQTLEKCREEARLANPNDPLVQADAKLNISLCLDRVGDASLARGDLPHAEASYLESLQIRRTLSEHFESNQELLRDLCVSLDRVGDVSIDMGKLPASEAAYRESLQIRRELRSMLGENTEILRDLSISLNKVGDVAISQGKVQEAQTAYHESLELRRKLRERLGGNDQVLRDLSISLERIGDIAFGTGNIPYAEENYRESLEIRRELHKKLGDNPQVLRDLSVSLDGIGNVAIAMSNLSDAAASYSESLKIRRELHRLLGNNPQVLRDLSISLERVGDIALAMQNFQKAEATYQESLRISRSLRRMLGESAQVQNDLGILLEKLGDFAESMGRPEEAESHLAEANAIMKGLSLEFPERQDFRDAEESTSKKLYSLVKRTSSGD